MYTLQTLFFIPESIFTLFYISTHEDVTIRLNQSQC